MRWLFLGWFWPFLNWTVLLEAAGAVLKIGMSLKPNHYWEIKLAQVCETPCISVTLLLFKHNTPFRTFFIEALDRLSKVSNVLHLIELQMCSNALKNLTAFQRKLFSEKNNKNLSELDANHITQELFLFSLFPLINTEVVMCKIR